MGVFTDDMARLSEEIAVGRASRKDMLHSLKGSIATLKIDVGEMLSEFGNKRAETKQKMQSELSEFTSRLQRFSEDLGEQVIDMRKGFHQERTQMLERMDEELRSFVGRLKSFAAGLDDDVTRMRKGFHQARSEMIDRMRLELGGFTNELKTTVGSMLEKFRSERLGAGATRMGKGHAAPAPETSGPQEAFEQNNDDLTRIPGIGAHRQQRLNQAGIRTFAQLARSTPWQLAQIFGKQGGPAKFEDWISHADAMAR